MGPGDHTVICGHKDSGTFGVTTSFASSKEGHCGEKKTKWQPHPDRTPEGDLVGDPLTSYVHRETLPLNRELTEKVIACAKKAWQSEEGSGVGCLPLSMDTEEYWQRLKEDKTSEEEE